VRAACGTHLQRADALVEQRQCDAAEHLQRYWESEYLPVYLNHVCGRESRVATTGTGTSARRRL
jgi:hypothetical protein